MNKKRLLFGLVGLLAVTIMVYARELPKKVYMTYTETSITVKNDNKKPVTVSFGVWVQWKDPNGKLGGEQCVPATVDARGNNTGTWYLPAPGKINRVTIDWCTDPVE